MRNFAIPDAFSKEEQELILSLDTPVKVQDFIDTIKVNYEPEGDTCLSPLRVLRERRGHCIEAAMFAAFVLNTHGYPPLLVDLTANMRDDDHVICVFRQRGRWGAISKSNHAVIRWRDPVYKSMRELAMSYFDEYTNNSGEKTLRSYCKPIDLRRFGTGWITSQKSVWEVPSYLLKVKHYPLVTKTMAKRLRKADGFQMRTSVVQKEWPAE